MVLGRNSAASTSISWTERQCPAIAAAIKYDDEGTPATKTYLIKEGILISRLHSRETAAKMGEQPTGNARAINYTVPAHRAHDQYLHRAGQHRFRGYDRRYQRRRLCQKLVRRHDQHGDVHLLRRRGLHDTERQDSRDGQAGRTDRQRFTTLENIDAIGNDLDMNQGGGCGKAGQSPLPVSNGSPHIRIRNCLVGGK